MSGLPLSGARILFRADGGAEIGSGHLRRCLTLATRLRDRGNECLFACRRSERSFNSLVSDAGFTLVELPETDWASERCDAEQVLKATQPYAPFNVVVADHYGLGQEWETALREVAVSVAVIDDLADRSHDCDILVDVAPGDDARYDELVPATCRKLLGPSYAMLRPEFVQLRPAQSRLSAIVGRILISFGGVDAENLTGAAIAAISEALPNVIVDAVVTSLSPHRRVLQKYAAHNKRVQIHVDVDDMAKLMHAADLAIGASGSTSWERACMGLPSIIAIMAENQRLTANALQKLGCAVAVSHDVQFASQIANIARFLSASPAMRQLMSAAALATVDGRGVDRVANAILPANILLRQAVQQDARQIWEWRNAPEIRETAIDTTEIPYEVHLDWFSRRVADPETVMLVAEENGVGAGVVRYDLTGEIANVSIFLAPGTAGRGVGTAILRAGERWLTEHHPEVKQFHADVRPQNGASIALFKAANYSTTLISFERNIND